MIVFILFALMLPGGLPYRHVPQCMGMESEATYELTISAALSILPPPLRAFLQANETEFRDLVVADVEAEIRGQPTFGQRAWHYIELDIEAPTVSATVRREAVSRFPRDKVKAKELSERHGPLRGGLLPWIIEERYENLRAALRAGNKEATLRAAAELLHFSADAAIPTQASSCCFSPEECGNVPNGSHELRFLYHQTCLAFQEVLAYELRIHPDRLAPSKNALVDAFDTAIRAYAHLDNLLGKSLNGHSEPIEGTGAPQVDRPSPFRWVGFEVTTLPIVRMQIEGGAILAANLMSGAWQEAGAPDLKFASSPTDSASTPSPSTVPLVPVESANGAFFGSKDSMIYHRATCAHVARIKPENRLRFQDVQAAAAANRTPCKQCKPDSAAVPAPSNP